MRKVVFDNDILYLGADIVPALIEENAKYNHRETHQI